MMSKTTNHNTEAIEQTEPTTSPEEASAETTGAVQVSDPAESTEQAQDTEVQDKAQSEENEKPESGSKANREAAKYRTQLRDTQDQLDALTTRHDALTRSAIEAQLPGQLPAKLFWKVHDTPSEFLTEDGAIDTAMLKDATNAIVEEFNLPTENRGPVVKAQGGGHRQIRLSDSLEDAFKPRQN